jgi:hypothetical protein
VFPEKGPAARGGATGPGRRNHDEGNVANLRHEPSIRKRPAGSYRPSLGLAGFTRRCRVGFEARGWRGTAAALAPSRDRIASLETAVVSVDKRLADLHGDVAVRHRLDKTDDRIARIEQRLGLIEA